MYERCRMQTLGLMANRTKESIRTLLIRWRGPGTRRKEYGRRSST